MHHFQMEPGLHHRPVWLVPGRLAAATSTMSYSSEVARLLHTLGSDAETVATMVRSQEVKGIRNAVRQLNPIVRYLQKTAVGISQAIVRGGDSLMVEFAEGGREELPLPPAVKNFLDEFNRGSYPDLISSETQ